MNSQADPREAVAQWMIAHGYPTGHGDTLDDLLRELVGGVHVECARVADDYARDGRFEKEFACETADEIAARIRNIRG
jgi:hypothetical protein